MIDKKIVRTERRKAKVDKKAAKADREADRAAFRSKATEAEAPTTGRERPVSTIDKEYLEEVVNTLKKGGIILYPTDTVWGIGCDATNAEAVAKVYALKQREESKSMLCLMDSLDRVALYFDNLPDAAWELLEITDKPLTLVVDKPKRVASNLLSEDESIGIRVTSHEFCRAMCRKLGRPVVSTSANISGEAAPARLAEISKVIIEGVDLVVDKKYEKGATGKPSSIIKISSDSRIQIIRE